MVEAESFWDAIDNVCYDAPVKVSTTHSGWTNLMSNITCLPYEGRVYSRKRKEFSFMLLTRPEQKNTAWIKDIVRKFTEPGNPIENACAGSFSGAMVCVMLCKHGRFIQWEVDSSYVSDAIPLLILLYTRQGLTKKSDIDGKAEVRSSMELHIKAVEMIVVRNFWTCERIEKGFRPCKRSGHISYTTYLLISAWKSRFERQIIFQQISGAEIGRRD